MEALQITLADGRLTEAAKLRTYFTGIFQAEESGEEFPVNLSHIWGIGYATKGAAVKALRRRFTEGIDFTSFIQVVKRETGGTAEEVFHLSVSCAEYFAVRANREVFEVYRDCRKVVRNVLRGNQPDFSNPAESARAWADAYEAEQKALAQAAVAEQRVLEMKPKADFYDAVQVASNSVSFSEAAKLLKLRGMEGRNRFTKRLKADKILRGSREPMQQYVDDGYFEVQPQTYKAGEKGQRIAGTTRITPRGLTWLAKRYKSN